jgi:hypothetical protein
MSGSLTSGRDVFAVGRGQYENIGDIILRRPLLNWAREAGRLHIYVGESPDGYDEGLGIGEDDEVHRSFSTWYAKLVKSAAQGRASSIYKPGEVQLTLAGMKEHVAMLPAVSLVRLRGGKVGRVGAGSRNFAPIPRAIMWPSNALSNYTRWRDVRTADYLGFGPAMPDLGFAEGLDEAGIRAAMHDDSRNVFAISLREDVEVAPRPYPDETWLRGVRSFIDESGLEPWVVTQVSVDNDRSRRLAADLGAHLLEWPVLSGHREQEDRLRALYRRAQVVASDRLHVIIAAYTEGAAPVGLQLDDSDKISRHFDTIGVMGVGLNTTGLSSGDILAALAKASASREEMLAHLLPARARLSQVRSDVVALLSGSDG